MLVLAPDIVETGRIVLDPDPDDVEDILEEVVVTVGATVTVPDWA